MILRQREKKRHSVCKVSQTCLITGITRDTCRNRKPTLQALPADPPCHNLQERDLVFFNKCIRWALWWGELGKQCEKIEKKNPKSYTLALTFLNCPYSNPWRGALLLSEQQSTGSLASPAASPTERKFTSLRVREFRVPKSCISHYTFINRQDGLISLCGLENRNLPPGEGSALGTLAQAKSPGIIPLHPLGQKCCHSSRI